MKFLGERKFEDRRVNSGDTSKVQVLGGKPNMFLGVWQFC